MIRKLSRNGTDRNGVLSLTCTADRLTASVRLLAPHLAGLRRYADVISVSQQGANAVVYVALSALIEDGIDPLDTHEPRLVIFRTFHDIWFPLQRIVESVEASLDRAIYCLIRNESMDLEDTAFITRRSSGEIAERVAYMKDRCHRRNASGIEWRQSTNPSLRNSPCRRDSTSIAVASVVRQRQRSLQAQ